MLCLYSGFRPFYEETFDSAVRELLYHDATVTRYDSGVHIFIRHNDMEQGERLLEGH